MTITTANNDDTICAIATVLGTGGISVIRISGKDSLSIAEKIFFQTKEKKVTQFEANRVYHGYVFDNEELLDEVILLCFKAPMSYTGEDIIEIQSHGGIAITKAIFELVQKNGARLAERGEFTKRAFLNGKIDLSQAESVLDIISAKTTKFAKKSALNLCGKLATEISNIRDEVIEILTHIVAAIDFPEEVEEPDYEELIKFIENIINKIDKILSGANVSNFLRGGMKVALVGRPNVGKSSLFNNLLNFDRAIVTDIAGTTRDVIEETLDIDGIPVTIFDTAGIREFCDENEQNKIEQIGINYSLKSIEEADIVMFLFDLSKGFSDDDKNIFEKIKDKKKIIIGTKADLDKKSYSIEDVIEISNLNKTNIDLISNKLKELVFNHDTTENSDFLTNSRQQESLIKSKNALNNVLQGLKTREIQDFISIDLTQAVSYLGEITGDDISQEIINNIFEKFCIGK